MGTVTIEIVKDPPVKVEKCIAVSNATKKPICIKVTSNVGKCPIISSIYDEMPIVDPPSFNMTINECWTWDRYNTDGSRHKTVIEILMDNYDALTSTYLFRLLNSGNVYPSMPNIFWQVPDIEATPLDTSIREYERHIYIEATVKTQTIAGLLSSTSYLHLLVKVPRIAEYYIEILYNCFGLDNFIGAYHVGLYLKLTNNQLWTAPYNTDSNWSLPILVNDSIRSKQYTWGSWTTICNQTMPQGAGRKSYLMPPTQFSTIEQFESDINAWVATVNTTETFTVSGTEGFLFDNQEPYLGQFNLSATFPNMALSLWNTRKQQMLNWVAWY